jgi:2-methylcitrate dehydratase PrpD
MDAMQRILRERSLDPKEIEAIDVEIPSFLTDMVPIHDPRTGLQGKYSLEYDVVAVALDGRAGINQYTDAAVQRPEARALMARVTTIPVDGPLRSRVVVKLHGGEALEATVTRSHGSPADPLTEEERLGKFHECAATLARDDQRQRILDLTSRLDTLADVRELTAALGAPA